MTVNCGVKAKKTHPTELLLAYMYHFVYIKAYFPQKNEIDVAVVWEGGGLNVVVLRFDGIDHGRYFYLSRGKIKKIWNVDFIILKVNCFL